MSIRSVRDAVAFRQKTPISYAEIEKIAHIDQHLMRMRVMDELPAKCTTADIFGDKEFVCMYCTRYRGQTALASHWILFMKRKQHVEIFEPLGHSLKNLVNFLASPRSTGIRYWLHNNTYRESPNQLQQDRSQQCGDWVALRVCLHQMNSRQFTRFINSSPVDRETLVSLLTFIPLFRGLKKS